jgi:hypothetical protein
MGFSLLGLLVVFISKEPEDVGQQLDQDLWEVA